MYISMHSRGEEGSRVVVFNRSYLEIGNFKQFFLMIFQSRWYFFLTHPVHMEKKRYCTTIRLKVMGDIVGVGICLLRMDRVAVIKQHFGNRFCKMKVKSFTSEIPLAIVAQTSLYNII